MANINEKTGRDFQLHYRCTENEINNIRKNARKANMSVTDYVLFTAASDEKEKLDAMAQKLDRVSKKMCTIEQAKNGAVCIVKVSDGSRMFTLTHEQVGELGVENIKGLFDPKKYEKFYGVTVDDKGDDKAKA